MGKVEEMAVYKLTEVADLLRCSYDTVKSAVIKGTIKAIQLSDDPRTWRVTQATISKMLG